MNITSYVWASDFLPICQVVARMSPPAAAATPLSAAVTMGRSPCTWYAMPTAYISSAPGRQMPTMAAMAPSAPRNSSPTRIAMLVALRPGKVWLMARNSTNSLSLIQRRLLTRPFRRKATTPPPKLVAPMSRNSMNISPTEIPRGAAEVPSAALGSGAGTAAVSFMALGCVAFQPVNHSCLGCAQRNPLLHVLLQRDEELFAQLLCLIADFFFAVESDLVGEFSHQR